MTRSLWSVHTGALTKLVPAPAAGRVFRQPGRVGLADCSPSGRARLDAVARWIQDVAYADVDDAGVADRAVWVVRRTRLRVERFPRFGERFEAATFCSGLGRMWAERRTTITGVGDGEGDVEAVTLWVHLHPEGRRPFPLTRDELAVYGEAAGERRVTARLRHPASPPDGGGRSFGWTFRETECDLAAHINNAAYWEPLEEELLGTEEPGRIDVEMEFRAPAQPGQKLVLCAGERRWIVDPDGETHASLVISSLER